MQTWAIPTRTHQLQWVQVKSKPTGYEKSRGQEQMDKGWQANSEGGKGAMLISLLQPAGGVEKVHDLWHNNVLHFKSK